MKMTKEQAEELKQEIDWDALSAIVSAEIGEKTTFSVDLKLGSSPGIEVQSVQDFRNRCGVMSSVYESVKLTDFGCGLNGEGMFWLPLHWTFQYKNGGGNGTGCMDLWYDLNKKMWIKK